MRITPAALTLREPVQFGEGSDAITPRSEHALEAVADALRVATFIHRVSIDAYTDTRGTPAAATELTQRRADAVQHWLVEHGIDASRLEAHGRGSANPIRPNLLPAGRAANRRAEFHILDPAPPARRRH